MAENPSNSGSGNSSTSRNNPLEQSPFGRLAEVVPDKDLTNLFSGVGNGESGGSPFGGGAAGSKPDLAYGGNPFAGDNFWNIFAGGVNPSTGGGSPSTGGGSPFTGGGSPFTGGVSPSTGGGSDPLTGAGGSSNPFAGGGKPPAGGGSDPLTGAGSQTYGISTSEIPNGFDLRVTIDKLVDSKLGKEVGGGQGQIPSFGGGQGQIPSFGGGQGQIPSFGGGQGQIPSFGGGQGQIPSFGGGQIPSFGGGGQGQIPFA